MSVTKAFSCLSANSEDTLAADSSPRRPIRAKRDATKHSNSVKVGDSFHDDLPQAFVDLLVYLAQEGVATRELFRRSGSKAAAGAVLALLGAGLAVTWADHSFLTLTTVVKSLLLGIKHGPLGSHVEDQMLNALKHEERSPHQYAAMHSALSCLSVSRRHLVTLLCGVWFRTVQHARSSAMSAEAMAISVTGCIFPHLTYANKGRGVKAANQLMQILIEDFAVADLFGHEALRYFTQVSRTSIQITETYQFRLIVEPSSPSSRQGRRGGRGSGRGEEDADTLTPDEIETLLPMFKDLVLMDLSFRGIDRAKHAITEAEFLAGLVPKGGGVDQGGSVWGPVSTNSLRGEGTDEELRSEEGGRGEGSSSGSQQGAVLSQATDEGQEVRVVVHTSPTRAGDRQALLEARHAFLNAPLPSPTPPCVPGHVSPWPGERGGLSEPPGPSAPRTAPGIIVTRSTPQRDTIPPHDTPPLVEHEQASGTSPEKEPEQAVAMELADKWGDYKHGDQVAGGVSYLVRYLGSTLVTELTEEGQSYGDHISAEAVNVLVSMAKVGSKKLPMMCLSISPRGICLTDAESQRVCSDLDIYRICFCTADRVHGKVFAYIARNKDNETMECHAFLCPKRKIAEAVTLTVAESFKLAKDEQERADEERMREQLQQQPSRQLPQQLLQQQHQQQQHQQQQQSAQIPQAFEDNFIDMEPLPLADISLPRGIPGVSGGPASRVFPASNGAASEDSANRSWQQPAGASKSQDLLQ